MRAIVAGLAIAAAGVGCRGEERDARGQAQAAPVRSAPADAPAAPRAAAPVDASAPATDPIAYAFEWNAVMQKFRAATASLPEPVITPEMTAEQKRQAAATATRAAGDELAEVAAALDRLHPPPEFARLHTQTRQLFREGIDGFRALADAIAQGRDITVLVPSIQRANDVLMAQLEAEAERVLGELRARQAR